MAEYACEGSLPAGARVAVVSRCAWTLFNFRRGLLHRIATAGGLPTAFGSCDDGFDRQLSEEGIDVRHIPVSKAGIDPVQDARLLLSLVRQLHVLRPHIVHAFTVKPAIYATLAAAACRVPVRIVTITGLGHAFTTAGAFIRRVVSVLYKVALSRTDLVFFQNRDDRELFLSLGLVGENKTRLIGGSGIGLEHFAPAPLPKAEGGVRFLMLARLLREKGVQEYLQAAEKLHVTYPDAEFRLLGAMDTRNPSSLSAAELDVLRQSRAVAWADEVRDVRPAIREAHVVVLPSYREGLPRSLLEGAAMGRALIATDVPGCREVVRHEWNGYLVRPADSAALALAMEQLILHPERIQTFGVCARQFVEENFDERAIVDQTVRIYADLLRRKAQTSRVSARESVR